MDRVKIVFLKTVFEELQKSLIWDGSEKAAIVLCEHAEHGNSLKLLPSEIITPMEYDYISRSAGHYTLKPEFITLVGNMAIEKQCHILRCHIHPNDPAIFSLIDERNEPQEMKEMAEKINGIELTSLVFGNSLKTIDGWFFNRVSGKTDPIEKVVIIGEDSMDVILPFRSGLKTSNSNMMLDRTIKAFGKEAVQTLNYLDVGVVGASGIASHILECIVRDNFRSLTFCDMDRIEESNRNRLPATTEEDDGRYKVEFYAKYLKPINPAIKIQPVAANFYDKDVQEIFSQADIIFGCVDSAARMAINRIAMANLIPYFDMGAGIDLSDPNDQRVGGQVYTLIPGSGFCLSCSGVFNHLWSEYMSAENRQHEINQGYLSEPEEGLHPLVMHLDQVIAGIGYHEMLRYVWELGVPRFLTSINMVQGKMKTSGCLKAGCINCEENGFLGKGQKVCYLKPSDYGDNSYDA